MACVILNTSKSHTYLVVKYDILGILSGEMVRWYIRALADELCNHNIHFCAIAGNYISSNVVKKYQQAFLAPLPGKIHNRHCLN